MSDSDERLHSGEKLNQESPDTTSAFNKQNLPAIPLYPKGQE